MVFMYFSGCTLSTTAKHLDACARMSAAALGITLEDVPDWQCCGAVFPTDGEQAAPKLAAVRTLVKAREKNLPLVTLCAACHHVMKQVNHQAKNDASFRETVQKYDETLAYAGETPVLHFMEVLRQYIGFETLKKQVVNPLKGRKIGAYYGCLLLRPAEVMAFDDAENPHMMEDFIAVLGAVPITYPMRNECCGGYRSLQDKATAQSLAERVVASAQARGAQGLVTACPLCQYQLSQHAAGALDVCYFTELLAEALDVEEDA